MPQRPPTGYARGYFGVGLWKPRHAENIGHVLRAAGCYEAAFVAIADKAGTPLLGAKTDTQQAWKHLPVHRVDSLTLAAPLGCTIVAVEMCPWATPLPEFAHPERALYLFGPEAGSLPDNLISAAEHTVVIPTRHCMNLAAAVQVVLYDRMAKRLSARWQKDPSAGHAPRPTGVP